MFCSESLASATKRSWVNGHLSNQRKRGWEGPQERSGHRVATHLQSETWQAEDREPKPGQHSVTVYKTRELRMPSKCKTAQVKPITSESLPVENWPSSI